MKLFPHHPTPPDVKGWHVPVAKMKLADAVDATWDLTLQKIVAHIDGVSDVRRIAFLADVSLGLARAALRHLLYYDTILLLDLFFFSACYAPRAPRIHDFLCNAGGIMDECLAYVCVQGGGGGGSSAAPPPPPPPVASASSRGDTTGAPGAAATASATTPAAAAAAAAAPSPAPRPAVGHYELARLMSTFCVGRSVVEWLHLHRGAGLDVLRHVDVRRLVQFGVIKGCLYRVHKRVVSKQYLAALATGQAAPRAGGDPLQRYTDGCHTFDQVITEQDLTDGEIMERLKTFPAPAGDLTVFYK